MGLVWDPRGSQREAHVAEDVAIRSRRRDQADGILSSGVWLCLPMLITTASFARCPAATQLEQVDRRGEGGGHG